MRIEQKLLFRDPTEISVLMAALLTGKEALTSGTTEEKYVLITEVTTI
jgi:hypothetical protein